MLHTHCLLSKKETRSLNNLSLFLSLILGGNLAISSALWDAIRIENTFRRGLTSESVADSSLGVGKVTELHMLTEHRTNIINDELLVQCLTTPLCDQRKLCLALIERVLHQQQGEDEFQWRS